MRPSGVRVACRRPAQTGRPEILRGRGRGHGPLPVPAAGAPGLPGGSVSHSPFDIGLFIVQKKLACKRKQAFRRPPALFFCGGARAGPCRPRLPGEGSTLRRDGIPRNAYSQRVSAELPPPRREAARPGPPARDGAALRLRPAPVGLPRSGPGRPVARRGERGSRSAGAPAPPSAALPGIGEAWAAPTRITPPPARRPEASAIMAQAAGPREGRCPPQARLRAAARPEARAARKMRQIAFPGYGPCPLSARGNRRRAEDPASLPEGDLARRRLRPCGEPPGKGPTGGGSRYSFRARFPVSLK
jgi:hypothetical protein